MIERRAIGWVGLILLLVSGCNERPPAADDTATAKLPPPQASGKRHKASLDQAARPAAEAADEGAGEVPPAVQPEQSSRYTSLDPASCEVLEENAEEGGYWRRRCAGAAGYALETSDSDLRQDITIITPDGRRSALDLSSLVAKGAFNSLGKTAEWRGGGPRDPRALIVRLNVAADPEGKRPTISNLVVARLDKPSCVVAVIPRGPRQNEKARAVADGKLPKCIGR
jgi:hypothetical protein